MPYMFEKYEQSREFPEFPAQNVMFIFVYISFSFNLFCFNSEAHLSFSLCYSDNVFNAYFSVICIRIHRLHFV